MTYIHRLIERNIQNTLKRGKSVLLLGPRQTGKTTLIKQQLQPDISYSFAKDHPLYKALKEFGRIIKSMFILTYYDELEPRQRIEKQLNKIELSNKFAKAVFFANNREFQQGELENQKISTACMVLIQNAIVLWNYLYVSQLLANHADEKQRQKMLDLIKRGSMIVWQHVNLQGEYDFTKHAANDFSFDLAKIFALQIG